MAAAREKLEGLERLPQFPAIATKVLRALSHDDSGAREIADFICADEALASGLLRTVNSPLYALRSEVTSIRQAIMVLGFEEVKRFLLTDSLRSYFQPAVRLDLLRGVWRHSLACALACEELSAACSLSWSGADPAYTAGLLHDIGRLGLLMACPREYAELLSGQAPGAGILEREREALGIDHCEAGRWLVERWGLPEAAQTAAAEHHKPPRQSPFDLQDLVRVAVLLTETLGFDIAPPAQPRTLVEIRSLLPHAAQYRFDPDPKALQARITSRLEAFD
ncbi:MAG: HDOD domain-containing protein [Bryobacteraceae bacterium]|jgi:HD-like signal output (HDOD) protein